MNPWMDKIKALPLPFTKVFGFTLAMYVVIGFVTDPAAARVSIKEANQAEGYQAQPLYEAPAACPFLCFRSSCS